MLVGISDMPLFVQVRPRKTKHGGESIDVVGTFADAKISDGPITSAIMTASDSTIPGTKEVVSIIRPKVTKNEIKSLLSGKKVKNIKTIMVPCYMIGCTKNNQEFNILVNLNNGHVVNDTERAVGKSVLLGFDKLSEKENKVLNVCLQFTKDFNLSEFMGKSGISMLIEVTNLLNSLVKKGFLVMNGKNYALSESLASLVKLEEFACFEKNEFLPYEFENKLPPTYKIDELLPIFRKFSEVKNFKECNLIKYDVEYDY
jgi:hypothetical protein